MEMNEVMMEESYITYLSLIKSTNFLSLETFTSTTTPAYVSILLNPGLNKDSYRYLLNTIKNSIRGNNVL